MSLKIRHRATAIIPHPSVRAGVALWPTEVAQLLEEHHLAAWSHSEADRAAFGTGLAEYLGRLADTEVCVLRGREIVDVASLCEQIERCIPDLEPAALRPRGEIDGRGGLTSLLRRRWDDPGSAAIKRRYYLWNDADALLRRDPALFGRVVDAIAGVAAEAEYASEDLLLIHRAVFIGGPALDVYAEDPRGQFRTWIREEGERPLWEIVSGLKRPPVLPYRIAAGE